MALEDAVEFGSGDSSEILATHFKIQNPDHEDASEYDDVELQRTHFEAARFLQDRLGPRRNHLVGRFANAIRELEVNENAEAFDELVADLRD